MILETRTMTYSGLNTHKKVMNKACHPFISLLVRPPGKSMLAFPLPQLSLVPEFLVHCCLRILF
jgi:hypothetical protein